MEGTDHTPVFVTPEGRTFQAGTYYPPVSRQGMPSFRQLLTAVSQAWAERRGEVEQAGWGVGGGVRVPTPPGPAELEAAVQLTARAHDPERGGFGGAPKFPPSMVLEWLLRHAARVGTADHGGSGGPALQMAANTLEHMAYSGTYDQLEA